MKLTSITLFFLFLLTGCVQHRHNHANDHMHRMGFEELVARFDSPERDTWQHPDSVLDAMGEIRGKTVAEIGAGTGYFTFRLADRGASVIAADVDDRFLNLIEERKKSKQHFANSIRTLKIPYDSPDLPSKQFDKLLIVDTYHHIDNRIEYFKKLLERMKPQAELYIVDFKKKIPVGPPDSMKLDAVEIKEELTLSGFRIVSIDERTLPYQYIIKAVIK